MINTYKHELLMQGRSMSCSQVVLSIDDSELSCDLSTLRSPPAGVQIVEQAVRALSSGHPLCVGACRGLCLQ